MDQTHFSGARKPMSYDINYTLFIMDSVYAHCVLILTHV